VIPTSLIRETATKSGQPRLGRGALGEAFLQVNSCGANTVDAIAARCPAGHSLKVKQAESYAAILQNVFVNANSKRFRLNSKIAKLLRFCVCFTRIKGDNPIALI
jgi:hypothetical protein